MKAHSVLSKYNNVLCSVSGGSDSDIVVDICSKLDPDHRISYVWFDTGVEFQATKDHIEYLESRYGISIIRKQAIKSIPISCREYGQPFLSKHISEMIYRLQKNGFQWEDKPFDELIMKYPKCISAICWWCNQKGTGSQFNIESKKLLKEFLIENPPDFLISCKCCFFAKKMVAKKTARELKSELLINGIRKAEGGVRAAAFKTCFDNNGQQANYRPLFWYKHSDKTEYCEYYKIIHSKCYTDYGLKRTGCVGCPFARDMEYELNILKRFEPRLYDAACAIYKDSYEYTMKYKEFVYKKEKL